MTLAEDLDWVDGELDRLRAAHEVPGVAVGVLRGDETAAWVSGVTSLDTGVEVTPDTVFQIGSNTKLYTATLAMRLVAEGRVDLDARVVDYLPDFRTAQPHLSGQVTVRQLLCHTSGIDGDFPGPSPHEFSSTMLARYVDAMSSLEMLHPPGRMFSYCNSGYVLLGRVIESVTAMPYWQALSELLTEPAALTRTHVLPQDIVPRRAAVGHLPDPGTGRLAVAPAYVTAPACAPAGSCPVACVQDVLGFVALHLDGGRARNGTQVLSADAGRDAGPPGQGAAAGTHPRVGTRMDARRHGRRAAVDRSYGRDPGTDLLRRSAA
jgi:CubicO group peptidase (beta-lactamase class C family)